LLHRNTSGFEALLYPTVNREGRETAVAIVRATFEIGSNGRLAPAAEQIPVRMEDVYLGDPGVSSPLEESDLSVYKPGSDIIVVGEAHAPHGRPASSVNVGVRVGDLLKTAVVLGDRTYHRMYGAGPLAASEPAPFTRLPLVWERTFGGSDPRTADSERPQFDARNPVGCGFRPTPGQKLPNIYPSTEDSGREPWSFLPVGRGWLPRYPLAGTYDAKWQRERAPFLPRDFDYRFFQCAPSGLVSAQHLRGDEPVRILNMSPEGLQAFTLPGLVMGLTIRIDGKPTQKCLAALDTVVLEPARGRVTLVWRRAIACRRSVMNEVLKVTSFAVSRRGAQIAIGAEADRPIGEPAWIS
jgi:hypothetical protein